MLAAFYEPYPGVVVGWCCAPIEARVESCIGASRGNFISVANAFTPSIANMQACDHILLRSPSFSYSPQLPSLRRTSNMSTRLLQPATP